MEPLLDNSVAVEPGPPATQHAEPLETWGRRLIRENFLVLLLTTLFLIIVGLWYYTPDVDRAKDLKEIANGIFYALLALLGVRPLARPIVPPGPAVNVENVESMRSGGPTSIGNAAGNAGSGVADEAAAIRAARDAGFPDDGGDSVREQLDRLNQLEQKENPNEN